VKKLLFLLCLSLPSIVLGVSRQGVSRPPLNIRTEDGTVNTYPYRAKFTNGTVTDNGDGTVSINDSGTSLISTTSTWTASQTFSSITVQTQIESDGLISINGTAGVSGQVLHSSGTTLDAIWGWQGLVPQMSSTTLVTSSATAVTSFVSTNLTRSITPKSTADCILAVYSGNLRTSNAATNQAEAAIFNGSTNLCSQGSNDRGCAYILTGATVDALDMPSTFMVMDCPGSTSAQTYTLKIKADGTGTTTANNQSTNAQLILINVGGQ